MICKWQSDFAILQGFYFRETSHPRHFVKKNSELTIDHFIDFDQQPIKYTKWTIPYSLYKYVRDYPFELKGLNTLPNVLGRIYSQLLISQTSGDCAKHIELYWCRPVKKKNEYVVRILFFLSSKQFVRPKNKEMCFRFLAKKRR